MNKSACLILGSCLALQAPIAINELVTESMDQASIDASMPLPLFQQEHGRELIDGGVQGEKSQPIDTARYVYQRTRELLPVPFRGRSQKIARALIETANEHQMDPLFLMAVINQESQFNPEARGSHGEIGLMQLKPTTAMTVASMRGLTEEQAKIEISAALADPVQNIRLGAAYLARLRVSFRHRSSLYISAYNMGAARVRTNVASGVEPRIYSSKVLAHYVEFSGGVPQTLASLPNQVHFLGRTLDL